MAKNAPDTLRAWARIEQGRISLLAKTLGVSRQAIYYWLNGHKLPSKERRLKIQELTGIPAEAWTKAA